MCWLNYGTTDGPKLHNDNSTIILDSEEEPLEEDDGSMELNPISEKESGNEEQDSNSRPSGAKLYNEGNMTIVVDYEEEPLEEDDDDNIELHPVFEKQSSQYDEQDSIAWQIIRMKVTTV